MADDDNKQTYSRHFKPILCCMTLNPLINWLGKMLKSLRKVCIKSQNGWCLEPHLEFSEWAMRLLFMVTCSLIFVMSSSHQGKSDLFSYLMKALEADIEKSMAKHHKEKGKWINISVLFPHLSIGHVSYETIIWHLTKDLSFVPPSQFCFYSVWNNYS